MRKDAVDTFLRFESDGKCFEVPIERLGVCGLGRSLDNTVVLNDSMASREHAIIRRNATGNCVISDLGSTNGTRLNGRLVTSAMALVSGDVVQIGRQSLVFVQTEAPPEIAEPPAGATQFLVEQQLVSVLVVDLRDYTGLSARLGAEMTADLMGEIFRRAGDLLNQHNCWSSKFIGDAIMAVWVHPSNSLGLSDMVNVLDVVSGYQEVFLMASRKFDLKEKLRFGCGFNAGMASIGNIGSAASADFTAMGEAVNIAFRLETATKAAGCDLMIAKGVFSAMTEGEFMPSNLIEVELKGYETSFPVAALAFDQIGDLVGTMLEQAEG